MSLSKSTSILFNGKVGFSRLISLTLQLTANVKDTGTSQYPFILNPKYAIMDEEFILKANPCYKTEEPPYIMRAALSYST
jgi:hypothetical protein